MYVLFPVVGHIIILLQLSPFPCSNPLSPSFLVCVCQCPSEGDGETESGGWEGGRTPVHGDTGDDHAEDHRPGIQQNQSSDG